MSCHCFICFHIQFGTKSVSVRHFIVKKWGSRNKIVFSWPHISANWWGIVISIKYKMDHNTMTPLKCGHLGLTKNVQPRKVSTTHRTMWYEITKSGTARKSLGYYSFHYRDAHSDFTAPCIHIAAPPVAPSSWLTTTPVRTLPHDSNLGSNHWHLY